MTDITILPHSVTDERAWTADSIDAPQAWNYSLPEKCVRQLVKLSLELTDNSTPVTDTRIDDGCLASCRKAVEPVLASLQSGRGFAIIDEFGPELSEKQHVAAYWILGQLLGTPAEQDISGTLLYDVHDTGKNVEEGVRFSITNAESSFHTDAAFNVRPPDIVGLLCLRTAKSGGQSQLVSAQALHNELLDKHPELLEILYRPFCFDRRGQFTSGELPTLENPVFHWNGSQLFVRYLRYYIEEGHQLAGQQLDSDQLEALDAVDELLRAAKFRVEFDLKFRQMLFTNNRFILHNRTAFEDYPEPQRRRHYVRLWLNER